MGDAKDRQAALDLFGAFGSREKPLHADLGGHTGVPQFELGTEARFFARHLKADLGGSRETLSRQ